MNVLDEVLAAHTRIHPFVRETPLEHSPWLSESGAHVSCKLENFQHTGSFKARGALSKVLALDEDARERGVVTASTGNHGAAVAYALSRTGGQATVFVPENASPTKLAAVARLGARIEVHGNDSADTEAFAREHAAENNLTYVPPYNDAQVIGGQGTIGLELERADPDLDAVFVSLGGGGLVSGIAGCLAGRAPSTRVVACSPHNSRVMHESVKAGRILDLPSAPTLSDGTAGGVEPGAITFELVRAHVRDFETVTENEIRDAMRGFMDAHHMMIEGAAAVAIAAFRKRASEYGGQRVAIVLCGANVGLDVLRGVLSGRA